MRKLLTIAAVCITLATYAQQKAITGTVIEKSTQLPLSGATVQSRSQTVITDSNGHFSVLANVNEPLTFSYVGMQTTAVRITPSRNHLVVMLEENVNDLNHVVVVGYSTQKKADLTGAVSVVSLDDIKTSVSGNSMKAIQGRVPGVQITSDGQPHGYSTVRIRGIGTLGNNDPLYVIDGIPTKRSMNELASLDIESIQVLKDASSASIYGSQAANGVIIITTRKGKNGPAQVSLNGSISMSKTPMPYSMLNTEQLGEVQYHAARNSGQDPNFGPYRYEDHQDASGNWVIDKIMLPDFLDAAQTMKPANTNWQKEIFKPGLIQQYNLSLSSGNAKSHVYAGADYYDNKGVLDGSYFRRLNGRINSDFSLLKGRLKIGENLALTHIRGDAYHTGYGSKATVIYQSRSLYAITPVHTVDGVGWGGSSSGMTDFQNPVRLIQDNRQNHYDRLRIFGNAFADLEIIKNLHFNSKVGIDYTGTWQRIMELPYVNGFVQSTISSAEVDADYTGGWVNNNTLNYDLDLGKSAFTVLVGEESSFSQSNNVMAYREQYALTNPDFMQIGAGQANKQNDGTASMYSLVSFFGKVNYAFDQRYLASFTVRRDGSSRFGTNDAYGTFPAFSLGWRLSEESFFKRALPMFSDFKLRYGWGKTGNQEIGNYASYGEYVPIYGTDATWSADAGTAYDINGADSGPLPSGFVRTQRSNPNLKWESSLTNNFGLDFGLFNSKITGSFDYYTKRTSDILISPPVIAALGEGANQWLNGATLANQGYEVQVNYHGSLGNGIAVDIAANAAHNHNKVVYLPDDVVTAYPGNGRDKTILGHPLRSMFGYVADGLFQTDEEVAAAALQPGAAPGRIRYKDLNGDKVINDQDQTWIGVTDPDLIYGLNVALSWKGFDFSFFFNGIWGGDVNNSNKTWTDFVSLRGGYNAGTRTLDAWSPTNKGSNIPALTLNDNNDEARFSTYFIESGSYLKLRNAELGYTLPEHLARSVQMSHARIYIRGENLLTFKKTWGANRYTGLDPEAPVETYPIPFSLTFGLSITF
jgi:TonB-linked SusC/RagA family outer membrane protein